MERFSTTRHLSKLLVFPEGIQMCQDTYDLGNNRERLPHFHSNVPRLATDPGKAMP